MNRVFPFFKELQLMMEFVRDIFYIKKKQ